MDERAWLGRVPATRWERHYGDRVVRCFVERPHNAYDLLAEAAARNPDGEALVCGTERLSYRAFEDAVARCAAGLAAAGIGPGDRVAMLLGNGIAFPVVMFAVLRLGAIAVPLSTREQTQGLAYMLAHSGAKLLVHDADLADRLPESSATPALAQRVAVEPGAPYAALPLLASARRRRAGGGARGGHRDHPLHLRHHRAAERRDAGPSRHLPLGDALRVLHGADGAATARWSRCR